MTAVSDRLAQAVPWRVSDLLVVYSTTIIGILLVLASWFAVSGQVRLADQVGWATVGSAGVIVLGAGNLAWLLAGRKAVGELRRSVLPNRPIGPKDPAIASEETTALVATAKMTHFHKPDCLLVGGKSATAQTLATHRRRGRTPCDVCIPTLEHPAP